MWTRAFWADAAERATKTAAQAALLTIGADRLDALAADWRLIAGMAAGGGILSILTSLASYVRTGTPSATVGD